MQIAPSTAFSDCGLEDCATMYLYGDDGSLASAGYLSAGDIPSFQIWDGSTNNYYGTDDAHYDSDNYYGDDDDDGTDYPESECLAFEAEGACCSDLLAADTFGCMDDLACAYYDSDATVEDGSCLYDDCAGFCAGDAALDACDDCDTIHKDFNPNEVPDPNLNPVVCFDDGYECTLDDQCHADECDACGECAGNNTDCLPDGTECSDDDQCHADECDACNDCGSDNPVDCFDDGDECTLDNQCEDAPCDACGECDGNNTD
jgi:hypothetical protein